MTPEEALKRIEEQADRWGDDRLLLGRVVKSRLALARALQDLHSAAERVYRKYGAEKDWTEWTDLRDFLVGAERALIAAAKED